MTHNVIHNNNNRCWRFGSVAVAAEAVAKLRKTMDGRVFPLSNRPAWRKREKRVWSAGRLTCFRLLLLLLLTPLQQVGVNKQAVAAQKKTDDPARRTIFESAVM